MRSADGFPKVWFKKILLWLSTIAMVVGFLQVVRVPIVYLRVYHAQQTLKKQALASIALPKTQPIKIIEYHSYALYPTAAPLGEQPKTGTYIGKLYIPKLHLTVPIRQGTALSILATTAGHLSTSVLPGELGTSLVAAHDVTYFHHIDELKPGDTIDVTTSQGSFKYTVQSHRIIHVGTNVIDTSYPSLVLETCYPLNALQLVNRRYTVTAALTKSKLAKPSTHKNNVY